MTINEEYTNLKNLLEVGAISVSEYEKLMEQLPQINHSESIQQNATFKADSIDDKFIIKNNYFALVLSFISAAVVFLPWLGTSASITFQGQHHNSGSLTYSGIESGFIACIPIAIVGGFIALKNKKWSLIFGILNFASGLNAAFGWYHFNFQSSFQSGSFSIATKAQYGLLLFILTSFIFIISVAFRKTSQKQ